MLSECICLSSYLLRFVRDSDKHLQSWGEEAFNTFLKETLVIPNSKDLNEHIVLLNSASHIPPSVSIQDVIHRIIALTVNDSEKVGVPFQGNIISLGYRKKKWNSDNAMISNLGIECYHVNSSHMLITTPFWQKLLDQFGEEIIRHILRMVVLIPIPNGSGNYLQVSGPVIPSIIKGNGYASNKFSICTQALKQNELSSANENIHKPDTVNRLQETLPSLVSNISNHIIGRHRIFYRHHPKRRLSRPWKSKTIPALAKEIWPYLAVNPSGNGGTDGYDHLTSILRLDYQGSGLAASLVTDITDVCRQLLQYRSQCDVEGIFHATCVSHASREQKKHQRVTEGEDNRFRTSINDNVLRLETSLSTAVDKLTSRKRKRRRGCRGGAHVRRRGRNQEERGGGGRGGSSRYQSEKDISRDIAGENNKATVGVSSPLHHVTKTLAPAVATAAAAPTFFEVKPTPTVQNRILRRALLSAKRAESLTNSAVTATTSNNNHRLLHTHLREEVKSVVEDTGYVTQEDCIEDDSTDGSVSDSIIHLGSMHQGKKRPRVGTVSSSNMRMVKSRGYEGGIGRSDSDEDFREADNKALAVPGNPSVVVDDDDIEAGGACDGLGYHLKLRQLCTEMSFHSSDPTACQNVENDSTVCTRTKPSNRLPVRSISSNIREEKSTDFLSESCDHDQVSKFMVAVCLKLFSDREVWGSRHNRGVFLAGLDRFVRLGRGSSTTIGMTARRMRLRDIPWLKFCYNRLEKEHLKCQGWEKSMSRKRPYESDVVSDVVSDKRPTANSNKEFKEIPRELFLSFLRWVYEEVIIEILGNVFYVTEGEGRAKQTLYYARQVWKRIVAEGGQRLYDRFIPVKLPSPLLRRQAVGVKQGSLTSSRNLVGVPSIRLVPKKTSLRPITNLRNVPHGSWSLKRDLIPCIRNSELYNCLHILRHYSDDKQGFISMSRGFGVSSLDEIHLRFREFVLLTRSGGDLVTTNHSKVMSCDAVEEGCMTSVDEFGALESLSSKGKHPKYYMAALDLDKCFDNVDTPKLYDLVVKALSGVQGPGKRRNDDNSILSKKYVIQKYTVYHHVRCADRVVPIPVRLVTDEGDLSPLSEAVSTLSQRFKKVIISDGVVYPTMSGEKMLQLVRDHLFKHVVQVNLGNRQDGYYTQIQGIPQGSVLSPFLCNLYYGDAETRLFTTPEDPKLKEHPFVVRFMDDYLVISTNKNQIEMFLQRLHTGLRSFGGNINPNKTKTTFPATVELDGERIALNQISEGRFAWCGWLIDVKNLEVSPDMSRLLSRPLIDSLTLEPHSGLQGLRRAIHGYIRSKCSRMIFDCQINSIQTITSSISQVMAVAAARTATHIRTLSKFTGQRNQSALVEILLDCIDTGASLICSQMKNKSPSSPLSMKDNKKDSKSCKDTNLDSLSWREVRNLVLSSFIEVFGKAKGIFNEVLLRLNSELMSRRSS